jgi:hypothetical protein
VDQELGAAVGQHIRDLRLLLTGAEQHRHKTKMRRTEHGQHEFDAVAEQQRHAVAASQAHLPQSRGDACGLLRDLTPRHPPVATDQRLAVRISRSGVRHHRPDASGPFAKRRHHTIAEARLKPHRGNGIVRPVHCRSLVARV